ncbi:MAG: recombinase [Alphaproteobacteria bacterium]|nr:recombinase [Alphaproteobacteria bacterium]
MPDTIKFVIVVGLIMAAIYGAAFALASFPPEQSEIIKSLPHDKLREK